MTESRSEVAREWVQGLGKMVELPRAQGTRKTLRMMAMLIILIVVMASQLNTYVKTFIIHSKYVQFIVFHKAIGEKIIGRRKNLLILTF